MGKVLIETFIDSVDKLIMLPKPLIAYCSDLE